MDWPEWYLSAKSTDSYPYYVKRSLRRRCLAEWRDAVSPHAWPVPCNTLATKPTNLFHEAFRLGLSWETLVHQRALCQLRCGQLILGHKRGRKSRAKVRQCICCNKWSSSIYFHILCSCDQLAIEREELAALGVDVSSLLFLAASPKDPAYPKIAQFASSIRLYAYYFWKK